MLETLEKRYRALRLYKSAKYNEAKETFEQLLEINPQSTQDCYYKAHTLWKLGLFDEAIISFDNIIKSSEFKGKVWLKKGLIYREQNKLDQSIHTLSMACNLNKDDFLQLIMNWDICKLDNKENSTSGLEMIKDTKSIKNCFENLDFMTTNNRLREMVNSNQSPTIKDIESFILDEINRKENQEFDRYIEVTLKKASAMVKRERKCC